MNEITKQSNNSSHCATRLFVIPNQVILIQKFVDSRRRFIYFRQRNLLIHDLTSIKYNTNTYNTLFNYVRHTSMSSASSSGTLSSSSWSTLLFTSSVAPTAAAVSDVARELLAACDPPWAPRAVGKGWDFIIAAMSKCEKKTWDEWNLTQ